jgi:hypothetical protein
MYSGIPKANPFFPVAGKRRHTCSRAGLPQRKCELELDRVKKGWIPPKLAPTTRE